jgi:hypothetical protein
MGFTNDAYGKPAFSDGFNLPGDLQAAANFADTFANLRRGTAADRAALVAGQLRDGMLFLENDTGDLYSYTTVDGWSWMGGTTASAVPTLASGWNTPSANFIDRRGGWAMLLFNAARSTNGAAGTACVSIPAKFRAGRAVYAQAWGLLGANNTIQCYYDTAANQVKINQAVNAGQSIALSMSWPVTG